MAAADDHPRAKLIDDETATTYTEWAKTLHDVLQLLLLFTLDSDLLVVREGDRLLVRQR